MVYINSNNLLDRQFFIPGNVPSSKNSKQWTGKHLIWSKSAMKYVKDTKDNWELYAPFFVEVYNEHVRLNRLPMKVSFKFIRKSRHQFDYVNPLQTVLDLMVRYEWMPDDNSDIILPVFEPYEYNKECPGVWIKILNR